MRKILIPPNAFKPLSKKRNLIEAVLFTGLLNFVLYKMPFTRQAWLMFAICGSAATLFFFYRGYKNRSLTEILIAEIKFKHNKRITHLRSPEYDQTRKTSVLEEAEGDTTLQKCINLGKKVYKEKQEDLREKITRLLDEDGDEEE